jgi:hypothetical protein
MRPSWFRRAGRRFGVHSWGLFEEDGDCMDSILAVEMQFGCGGSGILVWISG